MPGIDADMDQARLDALLRERAAALAAPTAVAGRPASLPGHLVVAAGEARYALPLLRLAGVAPRTACATVPGARRPLLGIAGIRGEHWAVFDFAFLVGQPPAPTTAGQVVLLRHERRRVALHVDRVETIARIDPGSMPVVPATGNDRNGLLAGFVQDSRLWLIDMNVLWECAPISGGGNNDLQLGP